MDEYCLCALDDIMRVLSKKRGLVVLNAIGNSDKVRFSSLLSELGGTSPSSLSNLLRELERMGLVIRRVYPEIPPRVEYSLSKEGEGLRRALLPLLEWATSRVDRDEAKRECEPVKYVRFMFRY